LFEPLQAIFPSEVAPVMRLAPDGERELVQMNWGFLLLQDGRAPRRVVNVRDDKILSSKFWRGSFEERRCIVPASSYCEPKGEKPATWHWFAINGDHSRPLFAFPGIWRSYTGPVRRNGETVTQDVYSIVTTEPNQLTATINHERMPVLLSNDDEIETWLKASAQEAMELARQYPADRISIVQSGADREDLLGTSST
jgi:putative SOS response-associated peptidase YedK